MSKKHEYTVCFLFDDALENVLLVRKNRTAFQGRLNGVGGEIDYDTPPYETPNQGAIREIQEETGIAYEDLQSMGLTRIARLGMLSLPHDCKHPDGDGCVLHYYAAAMKHGVKHTEKTDTGEELVMEPVEDILASNVKSTRYAGDGDLPYFVNAGLNVLRRYLPGKE